MRLKMIMKLIMRKKENVRLKIQITSYVMALIILVTPLFNMNRSNKDLHSLFPKVSASSNEDEEKENVRSFNDLALEVEAIYDIDFSNMVIPILSNDSCELQYAIDRTDSRVIYDEANKILNMIINNSTNYASNNSNYVSLEINGLDDIYGIDKIAVKDILKTSIKEILKRGTNKDICLISNLSVVISYDKNIDKDVSFKYFKDNNLLVIYLNNIRENAKENGSYFWTLLEDELNLELNKIRQNACMHQEQSNVFYNETLRESSLSSELYNYGIMGNISYMDAINYERLVLLLGLFNENTSYYDYQRSIFNNDIELFYNFCGVKDSDDINRLSKIMYCIDLINGNMDDAIGYDYRVDLFSMIINNMINYTCCNKDFKLNDNLVIFTIVKDIIHSNIDFVDSNALEGIMRLNDIYLKFLAKHYNYEISKIEDMLRSEKISNYVKALIDICNNNIDYDLDMSYTKHSMELVNRFPLLRYILSTYGLYDYSADNKEENIELVRSRVLGS